jgi:hypothetical protein
MKRTFALAAAACTLAVPAVAFGQTFVGLYEGHILSAPDTSVTVQFSGAHNPGGDTEIRLQKFVTHDLVVNCDDGVVATLDHAKLKGKIVVGSRGNFRVKDDNGKTLFKVNGHIGKNKAIGQFRLTGKITGTDNVVRECDSGRLAWVARPPKS